MKLIIEILEDLYFRAKWNQYAMGDSSITREIIANGTPLPKGHGRLIDADALKQDLSFFYDGLATAKMVIDSVPTIIEADKERRERR